MREQFHPFKSASARKAYISQYDRKGLARQEGLGDGVDKLTY